MTDDDPSGFRRFHGEVDKLFAELLRGSWAPRPGTTGFRPSADVYYHPQENAVMVRLELPGIDPDRITLEIEGNRLHVSGARLEQRPPDAVYHQMEIAYGRFERSVALPPGLDITRASADYNSGYREISLPLKGPSSSRQIPISQTPDDDEGTEGGPQ
jgi:HSP20 family protein